MLSEKLKSFINPIIDFCSLEFPKKCSCCETEYVDFKHFIEQTTPIGSVTGGTPDGSVKRDIFGILSWVNCACGSTMIISCMDVQKGMYQIFKEVVINEAQTQNTTPETILNEIRQEIRQKIVS